MLCNNMHYLYTVPVSSDCCNSVQLVLVSLKVVYLKCQKPEKAKDPVQFAEEKQMRPFVIFFFTVDMQCGSDA